MSTKHESAHAAFLTPNLQYLLSLFALLNLFRKIIEIQITFIIFFVFAKKYNGYKIK